MLKRGGALPAPQDAFESDEAYVRYRSSQVDLYQMRLFMRCVAVVAALATLSLLYQYTRHSDSPHLIYALMTAVLAVWSWLLRFDDAQPGSPAPSKRSPKKQVVGGLMHLLILEGFPAAIHAYQRNVTVGTMFACVWACCIVGVGIHRRLSARRHRSAQQALEAQRVFPRL